MRKLAYLSMLISVVLAVMTLLTTNLLATDGSELQRLTQALQEKREEVEGLRYQMVKTKSLNSVCERAAEIGFNE